LRDWPASQLEQAILRLLAGRREGATICPSDAARTVSPAASHELMDGGRTAAGHLVDQGEITQRGQVVNPAAARGPIRIHCRGVASRAIAPLAAEARFLAGWLMCALECST
jgi:Protein of unknown function (DUF3253)